MSIDNMTEAAVKPTTASSSANGHASTSAANGSQKAATNGNYQEQHEEMQYLNMIADIMARGQVRVSCPTHKPCTPISN